MSRRERILDTAIDLFNEQGTGPISTNHIAQAMGISPGNLYYHFRNKEEIVRAIYARLRPIWAAASALPTDRSPTLADLRRILANHFRIVWSYRFYYRELPVLLRRDPELAKEYRDVRREGLRNVEALLRFFTAAGVMRAQEDPAGFAELAEVCWVLVDFWLPFAELGDDALKPATVDRGINLIMRVLHPYFTEATLKELSSGQRDDSSREGISS